MIWNMEILLAVIAVCITQVIGIGAIAWFAHKSVERHTKLISQLAVFKKSQTSEDMYNAWAITQKNEEPGEAPAEKEELFYSADELPEDVQEAIGKNL
jgi:uncharacterized protein YxeA